MKYYLNNRKAKQELVPLFEEARRLSGLEYGYFETGDFYTALKIRNNYVGFIMVKLTPFSDAEIVYSFVTEGQRRKGHYTEMLKGTRKHIIKQLDNTPYGIVVNNPKIPYLHECRGAVNDAASGKLWYDLPQLLEEEKRQMQARPEWQKNNRLLPSYNQLKADAWETLSQAPWQGGGWGYNPHQYSVKRNWKEKDDFYAMVEFIRNFGERVRYGRELYDVVYFDTHRVWNCSLIEHPFETSIINRKPITAP